MKLIVTEDNIKELMQEATCGFEVTIYCEPCGRALLHICVDGYVRCPVCGAGLGWCEGCSLAGEPSNGE